MIHNNLAEKLSLQVESFQEGFEILSNSGSFKEMTMNFAHLLRANFLIKDVCLVHKNSSTAEWEFTGLNNYIDRSELSYLKTGDTLTINYPHNQKINAAIVLPLSDHSFLGILTGRKLDGKEFSDFDKITMQILLQVFDNAHRTFLNQKKEKELVFDLNEKIYQLNSLIDTGIELSRYEKQSHLYEVVLERASSLTNSASAFIRIAGNNRDFEQYYTFPSGIDPGMIQRSDLKIESSFDFMDKTYLIVLSGKETRKGVKNFDELDKLLLDAIMRQLSASIENQYLLRQSLEKKRIEQELSVAATIQQRIIPKELHKIEGYDIAGINIPSKEVGGDYYDCIKLSNGKLAAVIADVAGKGISAALLVNTLHAALYSYLDFNMPLVEIFDKLNKLIYKSSPPDKYITCFTAILDPQTGSLDAVNAGHNPVFLLRKNHALEKIDAGGTGLGMLDFGIPYSGEKLTLNPGDKLFLYTDGIPEAMDENENQYSDERMIDFLDKTCESSSDEFINALIKDIQAFVKEAEQSDDITAMILKRL